MLSLEWNLKVESEGLADGMQDKLRRSHAWGLRNWAKEVPRPEVGKPRKSRWGLKEVGA